MRVKVFQVGCLDKEDIHSCADGSTEPDERMVPDDSISTSAGSDSLNSSFCLFVGRFSSSLDSSSCACFFGEVI